MKDIDEKILMAEEIKSHFQISKRQSIKKILRIIEKQEESENQNTENQEGEMQH